MHARYKYFANLSRSGFSWAQNHLANLRESSIERPPRRRKPFSLFSSRFLAECVTEFEAFEPKLERLHLKRRKRHFPTDSNPVDGNYASRRVNDSKLRPYQVVQSRTVIVTL